MKNKRYGTDKLITEPDLWFRQRQRLFISMEMISIVFDLEDAEAK